MSAQSQIRQHLRLADAAKVARRSERTIRNWVRDGLLKPVARGWFDRDEVLAVERQQRSRVGRPQPSAPTVVQVTPGKWVEVTACGTHAEALKAGMIALTCTRCRLRPAEDQTTNHEIRSHHADQ